MEVDPLMSSPNARWLTKALAALWATLVPAVALACPACAGRDDGTSLRTFAVLASMVFVPFVVAGVIVRIVRRIESDSPR
jgi:hypothetical protein